MESKPSTSHLEAVKSPDLYKPQEGIERGVSEMGMEQKPEASPDAALPAPKVILPVLPSLPSPVQEDVATPQVVADSPLTAGDDDLIEKEWVDKAKQIIASTKDDPHLREQEVAKLQADYLRKRYGKELGASQ